MKTPNNPLEVFLAVNELLKILTFFLPTEEGKKRRARNRRYKELKKLRKKRDKGKITPEQYKEELLEIERKYKIN